MTTRDKLIQLLDMNFGYVEEMEAEKLADYLIENGVTVQPSPQNNHRKICPTTRLECIACVPGSPCANLEQELETDQWYEPMTR